MYKAKKHSIKKFRSLLTVFLFLPLTGCVYQMPTDKCISTLPNVNNPHITHEKASVIPVKR